jgi:hypothetical protein
MKRLAYVLLCCCPALACGNDPPPDGGGKQTLTLNAEDGGSGNFAYCDNDHCETLPNPGGCKTLTITIDTATGKTCETCTAPDGSGSEKCGNTSVACEVVTIPDPDCVVCAYINGAVVFSSCAPPPDKCTNVACPPVVYPCPDGTHAEPDPTGCCGTICVPTVCNMMCPAIAQQACPDGTHSEPDPTRCCGTICVPNTCADVACPPTAYPQCPSGLTPIPDPTRCCGYICPPDSCDMVMCAALIACPPGTTTVTDAPYCCGTCVPETCLSDTDCPKYQHCSIECVGGCATSTPDVVCVDGCSGICVPDATTN